MKNLKTKLTATALSALMAISATGAVTASAATNDTTNNKEARTVYFINNKNWDDVYSYSWNADGSSVAFPGSEMKEIGTTGILGTSYSLYSTTVYTDTADNILFDTGFEHGQQSSDIDLTKTSANCFYLDNDNKAVEIHAFSEDQINFNSSSTGLRGSANESNNRNCYKSDGSNILFINTSELGGSKPVVTLTGLNGSTTQVEAIPQTNANGEMLGMYYVKVPNGSYQHIELMVKATKYTTDITDTTDSVKISENKAVACQRVFFNNDLSCKHKAGQAISAYAWNSSTKKAEVASFSDAKRMTYYQNVCGSINQYFYDVPLTCDSIIFLSADCETGKTEVQTTDITLNYTTNTSSSIIMDGYAPNGKTTDGKAEVSLFHDHVVANAYSI